jgi:hypothetical protein
MINPLGTANPSANVTVAIEDCEGVAVFERANATLLK